MISILKRRYSPIGVDLGSHSVKLVQMNGDRSTIVQAARWDLASGEDEVGDDPYGKALTNAIMQASESKRFYGHDAVVCLGARELFVQNIRVPKSPDADLLGVILQEAEGKLPFPVGEAEIRYLEAADIRHGDTTRREVILLACHKPVLQRFLAAVTAAGLCPRAVEVEPTALLRCYARQYRRGVDGQQRMMYVHIGATKTAVVIAQGTAALFVKYLDIGGMQMDQAVARGLGMELPAATMLRSHNSDRRREDRDPELTQSITKVLRPVWDRLASELSLCARYHSVTFRGSPLSRMVCGGGEATSELVDALTTRLDLPCELGEPFRTLRAEVDKRRETQWAVATGLALREVL